MTLLVPFDDTELSAAALDRATEFGEFTGEDVVALAVIPPDAEFARDRGWLGAGEQFDTEMICTRLRQRVEDVAPDATFRCEETEETDYRATLTTDVTRTIRQVAADVQASIIFVGSENAGRVSTPLTSVGNPLSEDPRYDVHIVRHAD